MSDSWADRRLANHINHFCWCKGRNGSLQWKITDGILPPSNFSFGGAWVLVYGGPNKHSRDALSQLLIFPPPAETLISNVCVWFSLCAFPCRGETRGREMSVRVLK